MRFAPTDELGTSSPSEVTAVASTTAKSSLPKKPMFIRFALCDRCTSAYSVTPLLIMERMIGSDWYGARKLTPPVSASAPSSSGAVDAPVNMRMVKSSPRP